MLQIAALTAGLAASTAAADDRIIEEAYFGIGALGWEYNTRDTRAASAFGGRLTAGAMFTEYIGIEAHFALGGSSVVDTRDTYPEATVEEIDVELNNLDSVLLRVNAPLRNWVHVYALAGFSQVEVVRVEDPDSFEGETEDLSEAGFSAGVGLEYRTRERYALTLDYVRYLHPSDFEFHGVSTSIKFRF